MPTFLTPSYDDNHCYQEVKWVNRLGRSSEAVTQHNVSELDESSVCTQHDLSHVVELYHSTQYTCLYDIFKTFSRWSNLEINDESGPLITSVEVNHVIKTYFNENDIYNTGYWPKDMKGNHLYPSLKIKSNLMPTIKNNYHEDSSHKATIENCNGSHEREDRTIAMFRVDFVKEKEQGKVYITYEWYVKYITGSTRCKHFLDYENTFDTIRHELYKR